MVAYCEKAITFCNLVPNCEAVVVHPAAVSNWSLLPKKQLALLGSNILVIDGQVAFKTNVCWAELRWVDVVPGVPL